MAENKAEVVKNFADIAVGPDKQYKIHNNPIGALFSSFLTIIIGITMCALSTQIDDIEGTNTINCSNTLKTYNKILLITGSALSSFGLLFFILCFTDGCSIISNINGNVYLIYFLLLGILLIVLAGAIISQNDCNGSKENSAILLAFGIISLCVSILWLVYNFKYK